MDRSKGRAIMFRFALIVVGLLYATLAESRTIRVGETPGAVSIKSAIAMSRHGDSVLVPSGEYREGNIVISKSIAFIGIGWPVLDGEKKVEVISVKASGVLVSGFRIVRCGTAALDDPCGLKVYNARHVVIRGNQFHDNFFGVYLQYSRKCTIAGNTITATAVDEAHTGNGVHCWKSDSLLIAGNQISGHRDGIYFEFVTNSSIERNRAYGNLRYGLHFMFSNNDRYHGNTFSNNGAGVAVMFTGKVTMTDNLFSDNWGDAAYGLLLKEISDSEIRGNRFEGNTVGIFMEGTSRIEVKNNAFRDNGWGMKIQASCMDNNINGNNFTGNTFDVATNGSVVLNRFSGNYWDRYSGYDLNKDGVGDVPYRPLSLFSVIAESNPSAMLLYRSIMVTLLESAEKVIPSITPESFIDNEPRMKRASIQNSL